MDVLASQFSGGNVCDCCPVSITSENNYVATLYRDNLDNLRNSWAGISTNGGDMFMNGIQIDQTNWIINACPSTGPDGVIIGDSLYSVFMSAGTGDNRVYFSASSLSTFYDLPDQRLSSEIMGLELENYPRIANYGKAVAVVWKDVAPDSHIELQFTDNIESRFLDSVFAVSIYNLENYNPLNADVAVSSTDVHVVWQEGTNGTIMYRKGTYADPVSINDHLPADSFILYPNPASNQINILINEKIDGNIELVLSDVSGKNLFASEYMDAQLIPINITNLPSGLYLIEITDETGKTYNQIFNVVK
jgi:hypothetical protein